MKKLLILACLFVGPAYGAEWKTTPQTKYPVTLVGDLHDADSPVFNIFVPDLDLALINQKTRIENFDSCEVNRVRRTVIITKEELRRGIEARDYVIDLFKKYAVYISTKGKRDAYGRLLVTVYLTDKEHNPEVLDLKDLIFENKYDRSQL